MNELKPEEAEVERVARALLQLRIDGTDETWERYRAPESWKLLEKDARAAIAVLNTRPTPVGIAELPTFEQAWAKKEAAGYQYGGDALENVAFGYEIAIEELTALRSQG